MKIAIVHNYYKQNGGENVYVDGLINLLRQHGNSVVVYKKNSSKVDQGINSVLRVVKNMFINKEMEDEFRTFLMKNRPDVVHIHNIYPLINPSIYFICKSFHIPIVQTIHTYRHLCPKGFLFRNGKICELCVMKNSLFPSIMFGYYHRSKLASLFFTSAFLYHDYTSILKNIDMFIFPAHFPQQYYIKHLRIRSLKTVVLPYFIKNNNTHNIAKGDFNLFVGRLSEEKGIIQLLEIFAKIPNSKLIVIGDGPLRKQVNEEYKHYKNITILGELSKNTIFSYMRRALFTIIPSPWFEIGPLVLLESFMNKTAVIAPRVGVFIERIRNSETGYLYNYNDWGNLKSIIINNQNILTSKRMGLLARKEYEIKYSEKVHIDKLMSLYEKVQN